MTKANEETLLPERKALIMFRTKYGEYGEISKDFKSSDEIAGVFKSLEKDGNTIICLDVYKKKSKKAIVVSAVCIDCGAFLQGRTAAYCIACDPFYGGV